MTPAHSELVALEAHVRGDLERIALEAADIERLCGAGEPTGDALWAAAAHLQAFYNGIESFLTRIAKAFLGKRPEGSESHHELLEQAKLDLPGVRPPVLSAATVGELQHYLSFRHFFRHAYGVDLEWSRMRDKAMAARQVLGRIETDVARFLDFVRAAARGGGEG